MNLQIAIEILLDHHRCLSPRASDDYSTALQLGIEALKRYRNLRDAGKDVGMPFLKGETKE